MNESQRSNLMLNYLPASVTETDLRKMFGKFGTMVKVRIIRDKVSGNSLGFGFVKYTTDEAAAMAIDALHGTKMENKTLKVSVARPEGRAKEAALSNVYFANVPLHYTEKELRTVCLNYGTIADARIFKNEVGNSRGCGLIQMDQVESAAKVIAGLHDTVPEGGTQRLIVKEWATRERADRNFIPGISGGVGGYGPPMVPNTPQQYGYGMEHNNGYGGGYSGGYPGSGSGFPAGANYPPPGGGYYGYGPTRQPTSFDQRYNPAGRAPLPRVAQNYTPEPQEYPPVSTFPPRPHHTPRYNAPGNFSGAPPPDPNLAGKGEQISLFVFHLPAELTDMGLQELFQPFATNGALISSRVIMNTTGVSKGFGFVNFSDRVDAQTAIDVMNGYQMGGKYLKVQFKK